MQPNPQLPAEMIAALRHWARQQTPSIERLWVFGSRAKGTARADSDVDLAIEFQRCVNSAMAELITHHAKWTAELTERLGVPVTEIHLVNVPGYVAYSAVRDHGILVYSRG